MMLTLFYIFSFIYYVGGGIEIGKGRGGGGGFVFREELVMSDHSLNSRSMFMSDRYIPRFPSSVFLVGGGLFLFHVFSFFSTWFTRVGNE